MAQVLERLQHELKTRRQRYERLIAVHNATTPSQRQELEVIFLRAEDRSAA